MTELHAVPFLEAPFLLIAVYLGRSPLDEWRNEAAEHANAEGYNVSVYLH